MSASTSGTTSVLVQIPDGYQKVPEGLGFTDRLQPFYRRIIGDEVSFGFIVGDQHLNSMGICHGGALMTLADVAAAASLYHRRKTPGRMPTVNLSCDFVSAARAGRWVHSKADHVEPKKRFGFCSGAVYDGEQLLLRYSGTYYLTTPTASDQAQGVERSEAQQRLATLMGDAS
ncbi:MAG: PaaI family thioesterase [Pseudomonadota bacterium]